MWIKTKITPSTLIMCHVPLRACSNIESKSLNKTYLNIVEVLFILIKRTHDLFIPHLKSPVSYKLKVLLNQLCEMSLFTKREHWLIFSALKKSRFLKSSFLLNFWIQWYLNILNFFNILMMLNKSIIWRSSFDVTI